MILAKISTHLSRFFSGVRKNHAAPVNDAHAATVYDRVDDLGLVTSYFNPAGYKSKLHNYETFKDRIARSNLPLLTIECAFGDEAFTLPPAPDVIQVRTKHIMWQKERLLNLAIARLPSRCTKVAWLDGDILFENPGWAVETSRLLDRYPVVQPFATAIRLPSGCQDYRGEGDVWRSFGAVYTTHPQWVRKGKYERHGETGFAWAARRDVVAAVGLYDAGIIGGGDHLIAHAMCGDWVSPCMVRLLGVRTAVWQHFRQWGATFYRTVRGEIGYVPGAALHLWHGERSDRYYSLRHRELESFAFDPAKDLRLGDSACWEWASDKQALHHWAAEYFTRRHEDGAQ
ncbi:MAG: hypothetical protein ACRERD_00690 [Candidatus Binatia bacterium]